MMDDRLERTDLPRQVSLVLPVDGLVRAATKRFETVVKKLNQGMGLTAEETAVVNDCVQVQKQEAEGLQGVNLSLEKGTDGIKARKQTLAQLLDIKGQENKAENVWNLAGRVADGDHSADDEWAAITTGPDPRQNQAFQQRVLGLRRVFQTLGIEPDSLLVEEVGFSDSRVQKTLQGKQALDLGEFFNQQLGDLEEQAFKAYVRLLEGEGFGDKMRHFVQRVGVGAKRTADRFFSRRQALKEVKTEDASGEAEPEYLKAKLSEEAKKFVEIIRNSRVEKEVDIQDVKAVLQKTIELKKLLSQLSSSRQVEDNQGQTIRISISDIEISLKEGDVKARKKALAKILGREDDQDLVAEIWQLAGTKSSGERQQAKQRWQELEAKEANLCSDVLVLRRLMIAFDIVPGSFLQKTVLARGIETAASKLSEALGTKKTPRKKIDFFSLFEERLTQIEQDVVVAYIDTTMERSAYHPDHGRLANFEIRRDLGYQPEGPHKGLVIANLDHADPIHGELRRVLREMKREDGEKGRLKEVEAYAGILGFEDIYKACHEEQSTIEKDLARGGELANLAEAGTTQGWWLNIPGLRKVIGWQDWGGFYHPETGEPTYKKYMHRKDFKDKVDFEVELNKHKWVADTELDGWYWRFPDRSQGEPMVGLSQKPGAKMLDYLRDKAEASGYRRWMVDLSMSVMKMHMMNTVYGNTGFKLWFAAHYYGHLDRAGVGKAVNLVRLGPKEKKMADEVIEQISGFSSGGRGWWSEIVQLMSNSPFERELRKRQIWLEGCYYYGPRRYKEAQKRWQAAYAESLGGKEQAKHGLEQGGSWVIFDPKEDGHVNKVIQQARTSEEARELLLAIGVDPDKIDQAMVRGLFNDNVRWVAYEFNKATKWQETWESLALLKQGGHEVILENLATAQLQTALARIPTTAERNELVNKIKLELVLEQDRFWGLELRIADDAFMEKTVRRFMRSHGQYHVGGLDYTDRYKWGYWRADYFIWLANGGKTLVRMIEDNGFARQIKTVFDDYQAGKATYEDVWLMFTGKFYQEMGQIDEFFGILDPKKLHEDLRTMQRHVVGPGYQRRQPYMILESFVYEMYAQYLEKMMDQNHKMVNYDFLKELATEGNMYRIYYDPSEEHPPGEKECLEQARQRGREKMVQLILHQDQQVLEGLISKLKLKEHMTQLDLNKEIEQGFARCYVEAGVINIGFEEQDMDAVAAREDDFVVNGKTLAEWCRDNEAEARAVVRASMMHRLQKKLTTDRKPDRSMYAELVDSAYATNCNLTAEQRIITQEDEVLFLETFGPEVFARMDVDTKIAIKKQLFKSVVLRDASRTVDMGEEGIWDMLYRKFYQDQKDSLTSSPLDTQLMRGFMGSESGFDKTAMEFLMGFGLNSATLAIYDREWAKRELKRARIAIEIGYESWEDIPEKKLQELKIKSRQMLLAACGNDQEKFIKLLRYSDPRTMDYLGRDPDKALRRIYGVTQNIEEAKALMGLLSYRRLLGETDLFSQEFYIDQIEQHAPHAWKEPAYLGGWERNGWVESRRIGLRWMSNEAYAYVLLYLAQQGQLDVNMVIQFKRDGWFHGSWCYLPAARAYDNMDENGNIREFTLEASLVNPNAVIVSGHVQVRDEKLKKLWLESKEKEAGMSYEVYLVNYHPYEAQSRSDFCRFLLLDQWFKYASLVQQDRLEKMIDGYMMTGGDVAKLTDSLRQEAIKRTILWQDLVELVDYARQLGTPWGRIKEDAFQAKAVADGKIKKSWLTSIAGLSSVGRSLGTFWFNTKLLADKYAPNDIVQTLIGVTGAVSFAVGWISAIGQGISAPAWLGGFRLVVYLGVAGLLQIPEIRFRSRLTIAELKRAEQEEELFDRIMPLASPMLPGNMLEMQRRYTELQRRVLTDIRPGRQRTLSQKRKMKAEAKILKSIGRDSNRSDARAQLLGEEEAEAET